MRFVMIYDGGGQVGRAHPSERRGEVILVGEGTMGNDAIGYGVISILIIVPLEKWFGTHRAQKSEPMEENRRTAPGSMLSPKGMNDQEGQVWPHARKGVHKCPKTQPKETSLVSKNKANN